jgi:predicted DNA-binding transcriptional regulator YafY
MSEMSAEGADGPAMVNVLEEHKERRYFLRLSEVSQWFMTEEAALGLLLARQVLESSFGRLSDTDAATRTEIANRITESSIRARRLRSGLRIVQDGLGRLPARFDENDLSVAMDAIADQKQMEFDYVTRAGKESRKKCSPAGLVAKDGTMYLLGVSAGKALPIHYALHRLKNARVLSSHSAIPVDFDLDRYIDDSHQLSHRVDDDALPFELTLRISQEALFHFRERPLSKDQMIHRSGSADGWYTVRATVPNTELLIPFLVSIGGIEVMGPPEIRSKTAQLHKEAVSRYLDVQ